MEGKIFRAVSETPGLAGIDGPYRDVDISLRPDAESQTWEGQQGTDSFYPYQVGSEWYAFYGSHNHQPLGPWLAGLAKAPKLEGPWKRCPELNPSPLETQFIENPIVYKISIAPGGSDGFSSNILYVAIYYSAVIDRTGNYLGDPTTIGYACSQDGLHWLEGARCAIHSTGCLNWSTDIRTPLCLIPQEEGRYALLYTAREKTQMFWSVGLVFVRVVRVT
jgi:hypothetical protein